MVKEGLGFALALPAAAGVAALLALATRRSRPTPPATARGQAVILRYADCTVLCTNERFANQLAQMNGSTARPGSRFFTTEVRSSIMALCGGFLVFCVWGQHVRSLPDEPASSSTAPPMATHADVMKKPSAAPARAPAPPPVKRH